MRKNNEIPNIWAVIPAAGSGQRMGSATPKQYLRIAGKTILEITLELFLLNERIKRVVVARSEDDLIWTTLDCAKNGKIFETLGGSTRALSVFNSLLALKAIANKNDWVIVHDAARPCLSSQALDQFICDLKNDSVGGILAMPAKDTIKQSEEDGLRILKTLDRDDVWHAQTPQMFRYGILFDAMEQALDSEFKVTDEASAVEFAGHRPRLIESGSTNLKITTPEDLAIATFLLSKSDK